MISMGYTEKILALLFTIIISSCSINHHYQVIESKHSLKDIHLIIIFDYLQHVRQDCNGCKININDVLNHERDICSIERGALTAGDNDINDQINLDWGPYQLHDFGTVTVCPEKFKCKDMYRFTHLIHSEKEDSYSGEVFIGSKHFLFTYTKVGDGYILNTNSELDFECN